MALSGMRAAGQNPAKPQGIHRYRPQPERIHRTKGIPVAYRLFAILAIVVVGIISVIIYMFEGDDNHQHIAGTFYAGWKGSFVQDHWPEKRWLPDTHEVRVNEAVKATSPIAAIARHDKHMDDIFTNQPQSISRSADEKIKDNVYNIELSSITGHFSVNVTYLGFHLLPGENNIDATNVLNYQILDSLFQIAPIVNPLTSVMKICISNANVGTLDFEVPDLHCPGSDEICRRRQTSQQQIKAQVTLLVQDLANKIDVLWRNSDAKNYNVMLAVKLHDEPKSSKWLPRNSDQLAERVSSNNAQNADDLVKVPRTFHDDELVQDFSNSIGKAVDVEGQLVQTLVLEAVIHCRELGLSYTTQDVEAAAANLNTLPRTPSHSTTPQQATKIKSSLTNHELLERDIDAAGRFWDDVATFEGDRAATWDKLAPTIPSLLKQTKKTDLEQNGIPYTEKQLAGYLTKYENRIHQAFGISPLSSLTKREPLSAHSLMAEMDEAATKEKASIGEDMWNLGPIFESVRQKIEDIACSYTSVNKPTNDLAAAEVEEAIGCRRQGRVRICLPEGSVKSRDIVESDATPPRSDAKFVFREAVEDIQNALLLQATIIRGDNQPTSEDSKIPNDYFPGSRNSAPDGTFNDIRLALGRGIERAGKYMDQLIEKDASSEAALVGQIKPTTWQYIEFIREVCHDQDLICSEEDIIAAGRTFENRLRSSLQLGPIERLAKRSPPDQNTADLNQSVQFASKLINQLVQVFPNSNPASENIIQTSMYAIGEGMRQVSRGRNASYSEGDIADAIIILQNQFRSFVGLSAAERLGIKAQAKCQIEQDSESYISGAARNFDKYLVLNCKSKRECDEDVQQCIRRFKAAKPNFMKGNFISNSAMCPKGTIDNWAPVLEARLQGLVDAKFSSSPVRNTRRCLLGTNPQMHISELVQSFNTETLPTCGTTKQCNVAAEVYSVMFKAGGFPIASGCSHEVLERLAPSLVLRLHEEVNSKFPEQVAKRDQECLLQNEKSFEFEFLIQVANLFIILADPPNREVSIREIGNEIRQLPYLGCSVQDMEIISRAVEKRLRTLETAVYVPRFDSCELSSPLDSIDNDLMGKIGSQISEYSQDKESTLISTASSLLILLLRHHQIKYCTAKDLDTYSYRVETEIRASINRSFAQKETQDSAEVELGIFQLRVVVDSFLKAYPHELLEDYVQYLVSGFTGLTKSHPADEVEKFLVQIFLESKKLTQISSFRQLELTVDDDIAYSLQNTTGWSRVEVSRMTHATLLILNSFFQSTGDERQRLVEEYTRKYVGDFQANPGNQGTPYMPMTEKDFREIVGYFSTLMTDFERYFVEYTEALRLVYLHPASLMHGRDEIPNIRYHQARDESTPKADGLANKNGATMDISKKTEGNIWSTSGIIAFSVTFGIMAGMLGLFVWRAWKACHHRRHPNVEEAISECCEAQPPPPRLRGILRNKLHPGVPSAESHRYHDEVDTRANLTAVSPISTSMDGSADGWMNWISGPRGNEVQVAKRLHTADHVPTRRLPSLQLPKPSFHAGRRASRSPRSAHSLLISSTKKNRITWGSTV